jgi:hypothetical protein
MINTLSTGVKCSKCRLDLRDNCLGYDVYLIFIIISSLKQYNVKVNPPANSNVVHHCMIYACPPEMKDFVVAGKCFNDDMSYSRFSFSNTCLSFIF